MNYTENFEGIKIDVQAVDISISDSIQQMVRDSITKLKRHAKKIDSVDVYFKEEASQSTDSRRVSMRVGIPGNDVFAEDTGENWFELLKNVEEKLKRQLEKR
ncbi:ribosome hibernation-promoting factor, HPF/YfiA family [Pontibacter sp. SGAir0037]|uniref:ribosome hibernation-promoting factor, HPF/YfiA family n=1 Tax=Pontibacter sp. SGAir0037 TaxID=2571030 RepID=UPI0010CD6B72|nr:ribosome-associated translation inhibitor RaiA [Pontibacter sp. SGAir0037]QCR22492.1 ribosome-associated translation inhibitor RaiA [Pontibacter sp. SGAir0037]